MKIIGMIGSRRRDSQADFKKCEEVFLSIYEYGDELVSGGCPKGGDRFAQVLAKKHQIPIKLYYAQWNKLGKRAGFARNSDIAKDSNVLIAVVAEDRTGGTEDTIKKFLKKNDEDKLILVPQVSEAPHTSKENPYTSKENPSMVTGFSNVDDFFTNDPIHNSI